jgi:hypothetical protein
MVEMLIVFPILIMLVFGTLQLALVYHAKETLNHAAFLGARNGALNQATYASVIEGVTNGLTPLRTHSTDATGVIQGRAEVAADVANNFVCVERLNPPASVFSEDYIIKEGDDFVVPNDNLIFRNSADGAYDGDINVHDANLLKIRVTYCHPLIVPFIDRIITGVHPRVIGVIDLGEGVVPTSGAFRANCYANNRMPMASSAIIRMQTSVLNDPGYAPICD